MTEVKIRVRMCTATWWHKVTHVETRHRAADIDTVEYMLLQRQLRWIGHVIRMPSNRLPRRLLYGVLLNGQQMPAAQNYATWSTFVVF